MKMLYERIHLILTLTGRPIIVFWWGIALWMAELIVIWSDFLPGILSYPLSFIIGGAGALCIFQAVELRRRKGGG